MQSWTRRWAFVLGVGLPTTSRGAEVTCVDRLQIHGASVGQLRARLHYGRLGQTDSPACDSALIRLVPRGSGFTLSLQLGAQKAVREVRSVNDAATWTESWLDPIVNERLDLKKPGDSASARPQKEDVNAEVPVPLRSPFFSSVTLGIGPEFALGSTGSTTMGPSLFGQYRVIPGFWLGMNVGYAWQLDDRWNRNWLRASAITGPAWNVGPRLSLTPGIGVGIYSGRMRDPTSASGGSMHTGGGFLELLLRTSYEFSNDFGISGALGAAWYAFNSNGKIITTTTGDDNEESSSIPPATTMPSEVPLLEFTTTLNVCYRFGGHS